MTSSSLSDWLERLETGHPNAIELGLDRVGEVALRLGVLQPDCQVVTVAGTNGKGSTTAVLEALALEQGLPVGLYTSPHLLHYNERVRLNGVAVSDAELVASFERVEAARGPVSLTYFEFGTLAALDVFVRAQPEVIILEVGLGGRLDAVNIVDPDIAIITSIAMDHEAWLGSDRDSIGREKAGVLRAGITAIVVDPSPPQSIEERLAALGCRTIRLEDIALPQLPESPIRQENVAAAAAAARELGWGAALGALPAVIDTVHLPGRLQRLRHEGRDVVLDVGHNPEAVENMRRWIERHVPDRRVALFAALSDKNIHAMIRPCRELFDAWYLVELPGVSRAFEVTELAQRVAEAGIEAPRACASVEEAWRCFADQHPGSTLVVFGSFHTVAGFLQLTEQERGRA